MTQTFIESFLANLFAGLLILFLASFLIPAVLSLRDLPRVALINLKHKAKKHAFKFTLSEDKQWETHIRMGIYNDGRKTLEKYYWGLYIEKGIPYNLVHAVTYPEKFAVQTEVGEKFIHIYGYTEMPIFPLDYIDFPYAFLIKIKEKRPIKIYYYFRTEQGISPFWAGFAIRTGKQFLLKKIEIL